MFEPSKKMCGIMVRKHGSNTAVSEPCLRTMVPRSTIRAACAREEPSQVPVPRDDGRAIEKARAAVARALETNLPRVDTPPTFSPEERSEAACDLFVVCEPWFVDLRTMVRRSTNHGAAHFFDGS